MENGWRRTASACCICDVLPSSTFAVTTGNSNGVGADAVMGLENGAAEVNKLGEAEAAEAVATWTFVA
jgi:hypothetical protein